MKCFVFLLAIGCFFVVGCESNEAEQERHIYERPLTGDWVSGAMGGVPSERK